MKIVLENRQITDKVLSVVVAAVSALLHSRPITHLSINIEDPEPLTPNHFLFTQVLPYFPLKMVELQDVEVSSSQFTQSQESTTFLEAVAAGICATLNRTKEID